MIVSGGVVHGNRSSAAMVKTVTPTRWNGHPIGRPDRSENPRESHSHSCVRRITAETDPPVLNTRKRGCNIGELPQKLPQETGC